MANTNPFVYGTNAYLLVSCSPIYDEPSSNQKTGITNSEYYVLLVFGLMFSPWCAFGSVRFWRFHVPDVGTKIRQ